MHRLRLSSAVAGLVIVIAPAVVTTGRALIDGVRWAHELRQQRPEMRRATIFGWQSKIADEVAARTGPDDPVDLVMADPGARDLAVFAGAFLAPRPVRFFDGIEAWRRRERAMFLHDDRAANAPDRHPPGPAALTMVIDTHRDPPFFLHH